MHISEVDLRIKYGICNILCIYFMASRKVKSNNSGRFISLGSKITVDSDYSHEIKRHLLLGRKIMTDLDSILKSRDSTLSTRSV